MSDSSNLSDASISDASAQQGGIAPMVTLEDFAEFNKFTRTFADNFNAFDRDGDFQISQEELSQARTNADLLPEARDFAGEVQDHFNQIRDMAYPSYDSQYSNCSDNVRNDWFGGDKDVNALTRRDLEVMLSLNNPQKFEDGLKGVRQYELTMASLGIGGGTSMVISGVSGAIGASTNPLTPLTVWSVPFFTATALTGTAALLAGMDSLLHPGEEPLKEQVVARMQQVANW